MNESSPKIKSLETQSEKERILEELNWIKERKKLLERIMTGEDVSVLFKEPIFDSPEVFKQTLDRNEVLVTQTINEAEEENTDILVNKIEELLPNEINKDDTRDFENKKDSKKTFLRILNKLWNNEKKWKRNVIRYVALPLSMTASAALSYNSPSEYLELWGNWSERNINNTDKEDPEIAGIGTEYSNPNLEVLDSVNVERSTYDFLGEQKIDYKAGYYMTSVFDFSDRTPPRFKILNDRENYSQIDSAAGITTNLFDRFFGYEDLKKSMMQIEDYSDERLDATPVIAYNMETQQIKAGHYKDFNENWMVSKTPEFPVNFKLNEDGKIKLEYHNQAMRMVPIITNEDGSERAFPIGVTHDRNIKSIDPLACTNFGSLEGGKIILVCGEKQVQVNGSFSDIYRVYKRLEKDHHNTPIKAFLLDNGAYNLPIWNKDNILTEKEIHSHLLRHIHGGTALVLINDNRISPYEYKHKHKEYRYNLPKNATMDTRTLGDKSVVMIRSNKTRVEDFQNSKDSLLALSSYVVIAKDGTRHLFDSSKKKMSEENGSDSFSLGIEIEGDTGGQFTLIQIESMIEYLRPQVEKHNIKIEDMTLPTLNSEAWQKIRELFKEKLYNKLSAEKITPKGKKALATIAYQDAYRLYKNKEQAMIKVESFLRDQGIGQDDLSKIQETIS